MTTRARGFAAALLLQLVSTVTAHGEDESSKPVDLYSMPSYAGLSEHSGLIVAHIGFMVAAWFFLLPIVVVFSISRSRYTLFIQFFFLVLNCLGLIFGALYNANTPDLYTKNAHHVIGWIATLFMTVQVAMNLLSVSAARKSSSMVIDQPEQGAFLYSDLEGMVTPTDPGRAATPNLVEEDEEEEPLYSDSLEKAETPVDPNESGTAEDDETLLGGHRRRLLRSAFLAKSTLNRLSSTYHSTLFKVFKVLYEAIDRTILVLGFLTLVTGGVTYTGIFRGNNVFNGLAHFIKGGIFFWYGLLTLGRWMGCFAKFGWAWNVKPAETSIPSAEFVESLVIFTYGSTNVFLEHLSSPGGPWSPSDLEHVSISILFFGGGLCGMLVESKTIRKWLNATVESMPVQNSQLRSPPKMYNLSSNPIPALVILLLGVAMSSHHQKSALSTMVHKQWGTLLSGFSVVRILTYIIMYISPPTSICPSRPPSELVSSFCLISGGLVFMASTQDIVHWMEVKDLMATFVFTLIVGFTAFVMAYEIFVLSLKGWVARQGSRAH